MFLRNFPSEEDFLRMAANANVIPLCVEILADMHTPVSLLHQFYLARQPQSPLVLLESVEGGERWGRYSFLGVSARRHIRIFPDRVAVDENGSRKEFPHGGSPFGVLRKVTAAYRPAEVPGLPRFWGGLVGYLTYEAVSFLERIPSRLPPETPLAHFIVPDELLIFDNIRHTLLVVAIAFLDGEAVPKDAYAETRERLERLLATARQAPPPAGTPLTGPARLEPLLPPGAFPEKVSRVKEYIRDGEIIQAVISQPFVLAEPPDPISLYRAQRYINPSPYLFFLKLGRGSLIGSSPETMVRLENNIATLRPIAGTRPRGAGEQEDRRLADELLSDEKERAEHLMLVDLGRNDLGRVAEIGTVQVTDLMIVERYSHVMHLVSNICCDLKPGRDAWDLLAATFPAGTLSGAPKVRAMEIIAEMEEAPRGPYGGAVGYVSFSGNMDMAITIRTAQIEDDRLTVRAGAGIVADSDPEAEHRETVNKALAIQKALELIKDSPF